MKNLSNHCKQLLAFVLPTIWSLIQTNIQAAETTIVSVNSAGIQGNSNSSSAFVSPDARYIVFDSNASNLVTGDTNLFTDVFVRERLTGLTTLVSIGLGGAQANGNSSRIGGASSITPDGRYVVFSSDANNLVSGDTNNFNDVFVRDRVANTTTRVSLTSSGAQANGRNNFASITSDGRYVVFTSYANNLVSGDTNNTRDAFVRDRVANTTTRVSLTSSGAQANGRNDFASITPDGRYVVFISDANNLVIGDTNNTRDAFVRDRVANTTTRASLTSNGAQSNGTSSGGGITPDGRYVSFSSSASNLVSGDTNNSFDTFVRDRVANTTTRVSVNLAPSRIPPFNCFDRGISVDGRYVTFNCDLPEDDHPGDPFDIYVRDRTNNRTARIDVGILGEIGGLFSWGGQISADGRYVGFTSDSDNLVTPDFNDQADVFLRDRFFNSTKSADLQVTASTRPRVLNIGQNGSYRFTIRNNGATSVSNVIFTDVITNGTVLALSTTQGSCSRSAISVCRMRLNAGASANITIRIRANARPLAQLMFLSADARDNVLGNNTLTIRTPVN